MRTNAAAAQQMQATTQTVLAANVPVAQTAVAAQVQGMDTTAGDLRTQAGRLTELVRLFATTPPAETLALTS